MQIQFCWNSGNKEQRGSKRMEREKVPKPEKVEQRGGKVLFWIFLFGQQLCPQLDLVDCEVSFVGRR